MIDILPYSNNVEALICSMKFLSSKVVFYLCRSTMWYCMEYCSHVWIGSSNCYLDILCKQPNCVCSTVGPKLVTSLQSLALH